MNSLSMAPRWVYGRRLELETRAFILSVRRESSYLNARCASFHEPAWMSTMRRARAEREHGDVHRPVPRSKAQPRPLRIPCAEAPAERQCPIVIASVRGTDEPIPSEIGRLIAK